MGRRVRGRFILAVSVGGAGRVARCVRALSRLPSWLLHAAAAAAIGGVTWLIFSRAFLNYDTLYGLIWGRDVGHGRTPDYEVLLAPTPHPLLEAVAVPVSWL